MESYSKSAEIQEGLAAADPKNVTVRMDVAFAHHRIGDMLSDIGNHRRAAEHFRRSLAVREEVAGADPTNVWKQWVLIEGLASTAAALAKSGEQGSALEYARKVIALAEANDDPQESADFRNARANAYRNVAGAYAEIAARGKTSFRERRSHWLTARRLYQKSLEIWLDMKSKGTLGAEAPVEEVRQAISRCDANLM